MFPTAITIGPPDSSSYFPLAPLEALFIFLAILQVSVLQMTGIIPLNLNNLFTGDPSGRRRKRKRRAADMHLHSLDIERLDNDASIALMKELVQALHKLDKFGCIGKTFCVLRQLDAQDLFGTSQTIMTLPLDQDRYSDEVTKSTTTESPRDTDSRRCQHALFKALLEILAGPNLNSNTTVSPKEVGPDYEYDEPWYTSSEDDTDEESAMYTSTSVYTSSSSVNNTENHSHKSSYSNSSSSPSSHSNLAHRAPPDRSSCDQLHKSCPITSEHVKLYTQNMFMLNGVVIDI